LVQDNGGNDLEEKIWWKMWIFFTSDFVPETECENSNVSIKKEYCLPHDPWEGKFDLSYALFESNDHNAFNDGFDEPPLDAHKYFIQYNHGESVAMGSQWPQPFYTNLKEECHHGIKKSNDKSHHFTTNFHDVDCSFGAEFNEE